MVGLVALVLIVMLSLGLPVAFTLLSSSIMFILIFKDPSALYAIYSAGFRASQTEIFIAIPMFVFMAAVLQASGIAEALYAMMYKWFAGLRGGLAMGTIAICTIIAAMTGLGGTGTVTMGMIAYPEMRKRGYSKSMALGCIPPAGALGPLIPPSIVMIIVGGFAQQSVGRMFMGGMFPGLLMSFLFMLYIGIRCYRQPALGPALPPEERVGWREKFMSLRAVILPILIIVMVLGTIYSGAATPTEAGGIGAAGTVICAVINRRFNWAVAKESAFTALRITVMVMWLIIGANALSALLSLFGVGTLIREAFIGMELPPMAIIGIMMAIVFVLGMLMDGIAITMICLPIFIPVVAALDLHWMGGPIEEPILWFCILFSINYVVGYVTPPYGSNLFYLKGVVPADVTTGEIYRAVIPFVGLMAIVLVVSMFYPPLLLLLPKLMG